MLGRFVIRGGQQTANEIEPAVIRLFRFRIGVEAAPERAAGALLAAAKQRPAHAALVVLCA